MNEIFLFSCQFYLSGISIFMLQIRCETRNEQQTQYTDYIYQYLMHKKGQMEAVLKNNVRVLKHNQAGGLKKNNHCGLIILYFVKQYSSK